MSYSHYNQHLYRSPKSFPFRMLFVFLWVSLFLVPKTGRVEFRYIAEPLKIEIPKVSMLIAALRDYDEYGKAHDQEEFAALDLVPTESLGADENYIQPRILNIEEGLSIEKDEFIIGDYRVLEEQTDSLKISKEDVAPKSFVASLDWLSEGQEWNSEYEEIVFQEEKNKYIYRDLQSLTPGQQNRLAALEWEDLQEMEALVKKKTEAESVQRIQQAIENASEEILTASFTGQKKSVEKRRSYRERQKAMEDLSSSLLASSFWSPKAESGDFYATSGYSYESIDVAPREIGERREHVVSGHFSFEGGLAYLGPGSQLRIWVQNEHERQEADIDLYTGTYRVNKNFEGGVLLAEYMDSTGSLLGFGKKDLALGAADVDLAFSLQPVDWGLSLSFDFSETDLPGKISFDGEEDYSLEQKIWVQDKWTYYSNFLLQTSVPGYLDSSQIVTSAKNNRVEALSESALDSIKEILREQGVSVDESLAMVSGRVEGLSNLGGFQVEITDPYAIGPIFLNDFLFPDKSLQETSLSGRFFFFNVRAGDHQLRIRSKDKFSSSIVRLMPGSVNQVVFPLEHWKNLSVSWHDALAGELISGVYQWSGGEDLYQSTISDRVSLRYLPDKAFHNLEFYAGENFYPLRWGFRDRREWQLGKKLFSFKKADLPQALEENQGAMLISVEKPVESIRLNHGTWSEEVKAYVYRDAKWLTYQGGILKVGEYVYIPQRSPGLHSVQFQLSNKLSSSILVAVDAGVLSYLQP